MSEKKSQNSDTQNQHRLALRNLIESDIEEVNKILNLNYPGLEDPYTKKQFNKLLKIFPEGQICMEDNGAVVGYVLTIIVDYDKFGDTHTYDEIIGRNTFSTHDEKGDVLYGIEVGVDPNYRGMRLGRRLYDARKELCEQLNLRAIIAGGRMPNYGKYAKELTPRQYIEKVKRKEIFDPVMTFQLNNDFHVKKVMKNYAPEDEESASYAALLEWNNVYFQKETKVIDQRSGVVRIGVVQWQMRLYDGLEGLYDNIEFFVDAVSAYQSDFIVFPEFFNAPLMAKYNEFDAPTAMRKLAQHTHEIRDKFISLAVSYNINIIAGSMPLYENGSLYNVSYLCRRDGTHDLQYKLHITPNEITQWGIAPGNKVKVFDTDVAKIGILICYDCEFPELSRLMADEGMDILFVPYLTDVQNGYNRVRKCAEARAVENECYVAIAGSVGNLPKVKNMDIQYAQSAIFSPVDITFPQNGIVSQATPNTETTILGDVDLGLLRELHEHGSVNTLRDRRKDIYTLKWKK